MSRPLSLSEELPATAAPGSMKEGAAVPVVLDMPRHAGVAPVLSYRHHAAIEPGTWVRVPLGSRTVLGVVWDNLPDDPSSGSLPPHAAPVSEPAPRALKPILEVFGALPPLPFRWRQLVGFAAGYYQRSLGEVALLAAPPELRTLDQTTLARRLKRLSADWPGRTSAEKPTDPATPSPAEPNLPDLEPQQIAAIEAVVGRSGNLAASVGAPRGRAADGPATSSTVWLLHGVTGSGKTEVYLRAAAEVLARGGQVLVLVPEINLTPQLQGRFEARFAGHALVAMHSGLTPAQRLRSWLLAQQGHADVVLGTRLAVWAPLARLGLIVVDEEHDPSFKQQEGARYSARDLAVMRGRLEGCPVVLGSATPSLESWHNAQQGRYRLLAMPERIGQGPLPQVRRVDLRRQPAPERGVLPPPLARPLLAALQQRIDAGEQSLVLLNRRGYAPVLHCTECGWKSDCPHCSAWRVFHKVDRSLRCHHCGLAEPVPRACPACGNPDIAPIGRGTEKLEEQLAASLTGRAGGALRLARIDADSTRLRGTLEAQLAAVHAGEVDVVVGTQMVTKGHDFRRITLVAAVNPDGSLFSADFRAPERLFALLMQAGGRAGRDAAQGARSELWVQTHHPDHPLFAALARHDYAAFAAHQLSERQAAGLPPYSHLAVVRADARQMADAVAYLQAASALLTAAAGSATRLEPVGHDSCGTGTADDLRLPEEHDALQALDAVQVYPPVPMSLAKVADVERAQMLLESPSRRALQTVLATWMPAWQALKAGHRGVLRWSVDVDPLSL